MSLLSTTETLVGRLEKTGLFECVSPIRPPFNKEGDYDPGRLKNDQNGPRKPLRPNGSDGIPVVVFTLSSTIKQEYPWVKVSKLSNMLYDSGFSIPCKFWTLRGYLLEFITYRSLAYSLKRWGPCGEDVDVLRIVVRRDTEPELEAAYESLLNCVRMLMLDSKDIICPGKDLRKELNAVL